MRYDHDDDDEFDPNTVPKLLRQLAGWVSAEGDVSEPMGRGRDILVGQLRSEHPRVKIYPRDDLAGIEPALLRRYATHIANYTKDGSVGVVESRQVHKKFGKFATRATCLAVSEKGEKCSVEDAIMLLAKYPLLLSSYPPSRPMYWLPEGAEDTHVAEEATPSKKAK